MRGLRFARAVVAELVSLIVDDALTFFGALAALIVTWFLADQREVGRAVDGFLLFGIVWLTLIVSMRREARARRAAAATSHPSSPV